MEKMTFEQMANVEGGRFLGWGWHTEAKDLFDSHPDCDGGLVILLTRVMMSLELGRELQEIL